MALAAACDGEPTARGPWTVFGQVTRHGRLDHAGIRVTAGPSGPSTLTDVRGGWTLRGVSDDAAVITYSTPGFADEARTVWNPGEQDPLALYRGRRVALPAGLEVESAEEIPPAGILLTGKAGERVLVDLAQGEVSLSLPAGWAPTTENGLVIGADPLSGGGPDPLAVEAPDDAFTRRGALEGRGLVMSRPVEGEAAALEVVFWAPGEAPIPFEAPVLGVGPAVRTASGDEAITLLLSDGWVRWHPDSKPRRLSFLPPALAPTAVPLFPPQGAGPLLCYVWGAGAESTVDCVGPEAPPRTVARLQAKAGATPEVAQVTASPALLVWRAGAECRAILPGGAPLPEPFPCDTALVPAFVQGEAVFFRDAAGDLHRVDGAGHTLLGRVASLAGGPDGTLGWLSEDLRPTLLTPDGRRHVADLACSPSCRVHLAGGGLLAIDHDAGRALHLSHEGHTRLLPLLSADLRAAVRPAVISSDGDQITLAGTNGFVRLDLGRGEVRSLVHRGWRFLDFAWPAEREPEEALPEIGLLRTRDRYRAVDLYTLRSEPLGEGPHAGMLGGRVWIVNPRGLYVVDDPAAEE